MAAGGSKKKKAKGPRGKKARIKAKLNRQWGEHAKEEEAVSEAPQQVGRRRQRYSRLRKPPTTATTMPSALKTPKFTATVESEPSNEFSVSRDVEDDESDAMKVQSSDDDDDEHDRDRGGNSDDDDDDASPVLDSLMKSIQTKKKSKNNDAIRDRDMSEEDTDDESMSDAAPDDGNDNSVSDTDDDGMEVNEWFRDKEVKISSEIFQTRFNCKPLTKVEMDASRKPFKLNCNDMLPSDAGSLELQFTIPTNEETCLSDVLSKLSSKKESNSSRAPPAADVDQMYDQANETFRTVNRKVLQSNYLRNLPKRRKSDYEEGDKSINCVTTKAQTVVYPWLARYSDMLVTNTTIKDRKEHHQVFLLHLLNHVLTSRGCIDRNNLKLKQKEGNEKSDKKGRSATNGSNEKSGDVSSEEDVDDDDDDGDRWRDQGFTRPTVLVLLPTRGKCHEFVHRLLEMLGASTSVDSATQSRFDTEFGGTDVENDGADSNGNWRKSVLKRKGEEWQELFGDEVNRDDDFKIGVSVRPKATAKNENESSVGVRLYTDFYRSDIIVASPIGLKMILDPNPDNEEEVEADDADEDTGRRGRDKKKGDADYLSSIEICLMQYADVLMMQNWDHVNDILAVLNQQPKNNNGTDFSRVRSYFLEGQAAHWRQLIISSNIIDPSLLSSFKRYARSTTGSVKMRRRIFPEEAALTNITIPIQQIFQRINTTSLQGASESRLQYFVKTILPRLSEQKQKHTLIYIPSYFEYCSIRNVFLKQEELTFVSVTEYSRDTEVTRGRARFLQGRKDIMLYSGRCHFFKRHFIKGARHLIFYGVPEHPHFYPEHVNATFKQKRDGDSESVVSCLTLFTKFDSHALERIVGTSNCTRMVGGDKSTFMFQS